MAETKFPAFARIALQRCSATFDLEWDINALERQLAAAEFFYSVCNCDIDFKYRNDSNIDWSRAERTSYIGLFTIENSLYFCSWKPREIFHAYIRAWGGIPCQIEVASFGSDLPPDLWEPEPTLVCFREFISEQQC